MARRETTIEIDAPGRDAGKVFQLREMSATQAEWWAARAFLALAKGGIEIPPEVAQAGLAGLAAVGMGAILIRALGGMAQADAKPLLDEMMACVAIIPDPAKPKIKRAVIEDDIEEVATLMRLRVEVFKLHTGFSVPGAS